MAMRKLRAGASPAYLIVAFLSVLSPGTDRVSAQQRAPVFQSPDILVPVPPVIVNVGGAAHLIHELHITNLQSAEVVITRLQVIGSESPNALLADFRDSALTTVLARPGVRRGVSPPSIIPPGARAVAYFWIELPNGSRPSGVRHRLDISIRRQTDTITAMFEGAAANVSRLQPIVLDPPLRGGPWAALYDPLLIGGHRTAIYTIDGHARIPARHAIDWIRIQSSGTLDKPDAPDRNGFGAEVLAVADGVIATAVDDMPDNEGMPSPGAHRLENASGNHIAIDIGGGRFAFYEHLKRGSIRVRRGDRVRRGQVIAQLGNSGSSSIGPHLHFHVADANSALGAEGLPFVIRQFEHLGGFRSIDAVLAGERWEVGSPRGGGGGSARSEERPVPNAVVRFR